VLINSVKQFCWRLTKCSFGTTELELKLKHIMHSIHYELHITSDTCTTFDHGNEYTLIYIQNVQQTPDYPHLD